VRSVEEVRAAIKRIESDERYRYPAADCYVNAGLALIQCEMKAQVNALKWVLGEYPNLPTSAA
jgi:hypothetical protein